VTKAIEYAKSVPGMLAGDGQDRGAYSSGFDAPGNLDDDEEDDEEDIGKATSNDLNYDSDEKEETGGDDGDNTELISLDSGKQSGKQNSKNKNVPKLRKPK